MLTLTAWPTDQPKAELLGLLIIGSNPVCFPPHLFSLMPGRLPSEEQRLPMEGVRSRVGPRSACIADDEPEQPRSMVIALFAEIADEEVDFVKPSPLFGEFFVEKACTGLPASSPSRLKSCAEPNASNIEVKLVFRDMLGPSPPESSSRQKVAGTEGSF